MACMPKGQQGAWLLQPSSYPAQRDGGKRLLEEAYPYLQAPGGSVMFGSLKFGNPSMFSTTHIAPFAKPAASRQLGCCVVATCVVAAVACVSPAPPRRVALA